MASSSAPCRLCAAGQRISTLTFAIFAVALAVAALNPEETPLRQGGLALCAALSGLAVFRFPVARLAAALRPRRATPRPAARSLNDD
jgi:hypothetical protein